MNAVAVAALVSQSFPVGTVAGAVLFELLDSTGATVTSQTASAAATDTSASATFASVNPGTYTVRATRQDGSGNALGVPVVSSSFTVTAPSSVTVTVPSSVSVTVQ